MKHCPRCNGPVSAWKKNLATGVCHRCEKEEALEDPFNLAYLTWSGWLLTILTIGVLIGLMIPYGETLYNLLPGGRYPALLLAIPVLLFAAGFFAVGALVLGQLGWPVWKPRNSDDE